jgi:MFS family permease
VITASKRDQRPALVRVVTAEFISAFGTQMTTLALPWFVLVTSGSATRMGLVFVVQLLPVVLLGVPASLLVARWGARRVTVVGDAVNAVLIAAVPALFLAGLLPFWALLSLAAAIGSVCSAYLSAQRILLSDVVGDDEARVTAGNALLETATSSARLAGPALAGFLIAVLGPLNVLWIDAASYALSAFLLVGLPRQTSTPLATPTTRNLWEGVRYLVGDQVLRRVTLAAVGYGLLMPFVMLALPVLTRARYDADPHVAGWLLAAWGGGTAVGTLVVARLAGKLSPTRIAAFGGLGVALPLWFVPWDQPAVSLAVAVAVSCMFLPAISAPAVALLTLRPPKHLRPHVMPVFAAAATVAGPIAYGTAGMLFDRVPAGTVLVGVAVGASLCAVLLLDLAGRHRERRLLCPVRSTEYG